MWSWIFRQPSPSSSKKRRNNCKVIWDPFRGEKLAILRYAPFRHRISGGSEREESFEIKIFVDWCLNEKVSFSVGCYGGIFIVLFMLDKLRILISDITEEISVFFLVIEHWQLIQAPLVNHLPLPGESFTSTWYPHVANKAQQRYLKTKQEYFNISLHSSGGKSENNQPITQEMSSLCWESSFCFALPFFFGGGGDKK